MSNKLTSSKYPFLPLTIHVRVSNRKNIGSDIQVMLAGNDGFANH
jgi:hypothetical protein